MAELKNVLIVEDDADMRKLVDLCLQADGHETLFATDGASAIGVARSARPDLIVLDLGLPAGDGFTVMDRLNAMPMLSRVPVIVVSGRDAPADESQALAHGARAFLHKPFNREDFVTAVREVLGGPGVQPASELEAPQNGAAGQAIAEDPVREFLHDLRTPLAVIEGFAGRIVDGEDSAPEAVAESAEVVHRNARKLSELVERFSESYRPDDTRGTAEPGNTGLELR
jgi:two-component system OmpR family response regulator